ncbi:MAG TPA: hypothetical protein VE572_04240 [Nitrososphaeraceae archaeon]|nr:hypothetical protein [Nitrososphaeraceae archaeon]
MDYPLHKWLLRRIYFCVVMMNTATILGKDLAGNKKEKNKAHNALGA